MANVLLARGDIFREGFNDLPIEFVPVPEWKRPTDPPDAVHGVYVRTMTAAEKDAYEGSLFRVGKKGAVIHTMQNARGRLASLVICDERSNRIFGDDDADELGRKSPKALDRILAVAKRLNGIEDEALENAKGN